MTPAAPLPWPFSVRWTVNRVHTSSKSCESSTRALAAIASRFAPVADLKQKVAVLDQLAQSLPREVAAVLKAIKSDLTR